MNQRQDAWKESFRSGCVESILPPTFCECSRFTTRGICSLFQNVSKQSGLRVTSSVKVERQSIDGRRWKEAVLLKGRFIPPGCVVQ
jgi:invasion protein IalB